MARYNTLVPLGAMTVSATGTTTLLSVNCGPLGGQVGNLNDYQHPPVPGTPLRQIILTNGNVGNAYLLPRGKTAAANPESIIAYINKGATVVIPFGQPFEGGILPENFCLDADTSATIVYGCGVLS
jgi:hypothetical protein